MAIKNFREGIRLVPVNTDPTGPREGQLQYSDGTHRTEGVHVYKNGTWNLLDNEAIVAAVTNPDTISTTNGDLESNTTDWLFTDGGAAQGAGSITHNTTSPLSGSGDLQINSTSKTVGTNTTPAISLWASDMTTYQISLSEKSHKSNDINIKFDLELKDVQDQAITGVLDKTTPGIALELYDNDIGQSLGVHYVSGSEALNFEKAFVDGDVLKVDATFKMSDPSSSSYELRIYTTELHRYNT